MKRKSKKLMSPFKNHNINKRSKKRKKQVLKVNKKKNKTSRLKKSKNLSKK